MGTRAKGHAIFKPDESVHSIIFDFECSAERDKRHPGGLEVALDVRVTSEER